MVVFLSFIGMACWGIAPLFVKIGLKDVNPMVGLAVRTAFTAVVLFGIMMINGSITTLKNITSSSMLALMAEAVFAMLIGDLAYFAALKKGAVSLVTIIMSTSPLVTILFSTIFLGEQVTWSRILGAGLIIIGIILAI